VDVSLLDKGRADVPDLPTGHTFIGVWAVDTGLTKPDGGVDLFVRYDDGLARTLGLNENVLKLWQYEGGAWQRINDGTFTRDVALDLIGGHAGADVTHFAVSAPEPSAVAGTLLTAGAMLLRRPGRRCRK
jgi:hypothetical protein